MELPLAILMEQANGWSKNAGTTRTDYIFLSPR